MGLSNREPIRLATLQSHTAATRKPQTPVHTSKVLPALLAHDASLRYSTFHAYANYQESNRRPAAATAYRVSRQHIGQPEQPSCNVSG